MMQAKDIMTKDPVTIDPDASIREAAEQMSAHNIGALPVYDGKRLQGFLTDRDVTVRAVANENNLRSATVGSFMTRNCVTCQESDDLESAINLMDANNVRRIIVTKSAFDQRPIGIFSLDDIARKSHDAHLSGQAFLKLNRSASRHHEG